jgi:hypothetical protein
MGERIELKEGGYLDAWKCICGNTPSDDGFFPCDEAGDDTEPDLGGYWDGVRYRCDRCGRVIDQDTGEVVGQRVPA